MEDFIRAGTIAAYITAQAYTLVMFVLHQRQNPRLFGSMFGAIAASVAAAGMAAFAVMIILFAMFAGGGDAGPR
jgi:hypothetical protein